MADPQPSYARLLNAAAAALTGAQAASPATDLLRYLGYDDGNVAAVPGRVHMLRAAATLRRLFRFPVPDAPGLVFFGGEADPGCLGQHATGLPIAGVAGSGLDAQRAFEACVGEAVEYLSQFAQPEDKLQSGPAAAFADALDSPTRAFVEAILAACGIADQRAVSWIQVRRWSDGAVCWFPADLCLRRATPDFVPPLKLSSGCAAGPTRDAAALHGLLELIERDAAALWWRGGQRGRAIAPDTRAGQAAFKLLTQVRREQADRQTSLLDITTDLGIPAVAAFSTQADGHGFAFGLSARTTVAEAACSAVFEMCQSELSLHVIAAKRREAGDRALNDSDLRQLARAATLNAQVCRLLQPEPSPGPTPEILSDNPLEAIQHSLREREIETYTRDLTRSRFGVPVMRVIAPALQLDPCDVISPRLAAMIARTGGAAKHTGGITLL